MIHLIKSHGCRRIAFVRGPENHFGAQERYQAYIDTLLEHSLHPSPDLISPPVDWIEGAIAMTCLLDERKLLPSVDFDAIVAASDHLALEAMTVLQGRGIRVPGQVAVIGYDDSAFARLAMPPLTSVVTPFYELGRQAVVLLLDQIRGKPVPEQTTLPGELIIRQSCGCLSPLVAQAVVEPGTTAEESLAAALAKHRERILTEMQQAVGAFEPARAWVGLLLDTFAAEMTGKGPNRFLQELDEILRQVMSSLGKVHSRRCVAKHCPISKESRSCAPKTCGTRRA
jgi:Periplasmic binding protein-like domain